MRKSVPFLVVIVLFCFGGSLWAEDFYLDSPRNKGLLRFQVDNDALLHRDSNFSSGWSIQYHSARFASWEESTAPGFVKWVGEHFPTLESDDRIVRYGQGISQNIITPGDLKATTYREGELPYAGILYYALNWQSFNSRKASSFQVSLGVLGEQACAEEVQRFFHNDLGLGEDPRGWSTQRHTEPIFNLDYQHLWRVVHMGVSHNGWSAQFAVGPSFHLGNLFTGLGVGLEFSFGWNMMEGFKAFPSSPGRGCFQAYHLLKPVSACHHGIEMVLGANTGALIYSVVYDGSLLTTDERDVEREYLIYDVYIGLNYHYYDVFSIRASLMLTSNFLDEDKLPEPLPGREQTRDDASFFSVVVDFHF